MKQFILLKNTSSKTLLLCLMALLLTFSANAQTTRYVNASAAGANNGSSWANAYTSLQAALDAAVSGDEIWVAKGTYKPSTMAISGYGRSKTFMLKDGVKLYGGFSGGEATLAARDHKANKTILSGDLSGNDGADFTNNSDNSYHVVATNNLTTETVLDGFTVTGGYADEYYGRFLEDAEGSNQQGGGLYIKGGGTNLTVANCVFVSNYAVFFGAAVHIASSKPNFRNCVLTGNKTVGWGGGIQSINSEVTMVNCVIAKNTANYGGGLYQSANGGVSTFFQLINCTVYGNTAASYGGALYYVNGSYAMLKNSIIWGNESPSEAGIYGSNYLDVVRYNNVQGTGVRAGEANKNENPQFVDVSDLDGADNIWGTADDGLALQGISPSANAGKDADITVATDITGAARKQGVVNMGAYETLMPKFLTVVTWAAPAAITYGTALSSPQLNATAKDADGTTLSGSFAYYTDAAKTVNASGKVIAAGTHTLYAVFTPTNSDYNVAEKQVNITVNKATAGVVIGGSNRFYNGTARAATATTVPAGLAVNFVYKKDGVTLASAPVNAGTYTVTATIDDANYTGSQTETYVIVKSIGVVDLGNLFRVYDGTAKHVVPTTTPAGLSLNITYRQNGEVVPGSPVNAGTYAVEASINDTNYSGTATGNLVIEKATQTISFDMGVAYEYAYGNEFDPRATATSGGAITYTITEGAAYAEVTAENKIRIIGLGIFKVEAKAGSSNYQEATAIRQFRSSKATRFVNFENQETTYSTSGYTLQHATASPAGAITYVVYEQETEQYPGKVTIAGDVVTVLKAGKVKLRALVEDDMYGTDAFDEMELTVNKATAAMSISNLEQEYNGTAKQVTVETIPANLPVSVTYNGSATQPTAAGTYDVVATIQHDNYQGTITGTLAIVGTTALGDKKEQLTMTFYPNPTARYLHLEVEENATVEVIALTGQVLLQQQVQAGQATLDVSGLRTGQYIVRVQSKQRQVQKKFIKR